MTFHMKVQMAKVLPKSQTIPFLSFFFKYIFATIFLKLVFNVTLPDTIRQ